MGSNCTAKSEEREGRPEPHQRGVDGWGQQVGATGAPGGLPLFLKRDLAIQPKLEIGAVDDPLEREAEAAADRVMRQSAGEGAAPQHAASQRSGAAAPLAPAPPLVGSVLNEPGQPLDKTSRAFFEPRFSRDLSGVRIHTGGRAADSAEAVGARGYTSGRHIVFGPGQFSPGTSEGRHLLAHELAHVSQQTQPASAEQSPVRRQVYGPPQATGGGPDFDDYLLQFQALESAAIGDGYSFNDRITAFRKIYYDSASTQTTYAGAVVAGGAFNILIPGAAGTKLPPSWADAGMKGSLDYLKAHQVLTINGKSVDIGHALAGADAAKHPTSVSLGAGAVRLRSNVEAVTFIGDLGSVVTEYIHGSTASFRDVAMVRSPLLESYYDGAHGMASAEDMAGNADAYAMSLDSSKSLTENLRIYYAAQTGGAKKRFTSFAAQIGLGALNGGSFAGDNAAWRRAIADEVFNAALAYAAGKGWKGDVVNVLKDSGPGLFNPTFWEMYMNNSEWVVDIFVNRMAKEVAKE